MKTHWRSITSRWAWLFLVMSLAGSFAALFQGSTEKREWLRYGLAFLIAVVWHILAGMRANKQPSAS
jgi:hypothetical protein